jgi:myosin heavy subunit
LSTLTKTFIVLQLVFAIGLAVMVFMTGNQAVTYRGQLTAAQTKQTAAVAAAREVQTQLATQTAAFNQQLSTKDAEISSLHRDLDTRAGELAQVSSRRDTLEAQVQSLQNDVQRLTTTTSGLKDVVVAKDQELTALRPQVAKLTQQNAELARKNSELSSLQDQSEKAIRTLQENLAQAKRPAPATSTGSIQNGSAAGSSVASLSTGTPTSATINGKVTNVETSNGKTFVNLSLGSRDGVQVNNRFTIYRGNDYVGDAVVQKVAPDQSVAVVTVNRLPVQTSDLVISGSGM